MYQLDEEIEFAVTRSDANFDRACDEAQGYALAVFDVDEDGHINNVDEAHRSSCSIDIEFKSYRAFGGMCGWSHQYDFVAKVTSHE